MNQDEILAQFNKWWNEDDDIPNDAPWQQDSMIQFAWAGYNAAIQHYKDSVLKECGAPVAYYDPDLDNGSKGVSFDPLSGGIPLFTSVQLIAARKGLEEEIERLKDSQFKRLEKEAEKRMEIRTQLATAEQRVAEACADMIVDMYNSTSTRNINDFVEAIRSGKWREYMKEV